MITLDPTTTRAEPRPATPAARPKPRRQTGSISLVASVALTATTIATAVSFCRVFPGWGFLGPVVVTAVSIHGVLTLARALRWPVLIAAPLGLLTLAMVIGMLYFRSTLFGFVPTRATWDAAWLSLSDAFGLFRTTVAPVPSDGGFAVATALAMGVAAGLADTFAFRAFGRIEAVLPSAVLFALGSSLGVDRLRLATTALWLVCVFVTVAVLRAAHGEGGATWMGSRTGGRTGSRLGPTARAALGLGAFAVLIGVVVGPRLPGAGDEAVINTRSHTGGGTEVLSPMVDIQARLVNRSNTELFTVSLQGEPAYIRLASLGRFDGKTFTEESSYSDAVDFVPDQPGGPTRQVVQKITITALGSVWLPAVYSPTAIEPTTGFSFDPSTASLIRPDKLYTGMRYTIVSDVPVISPDELRGSATSSPDDRYLSLPDGFPQDLIDTAVAITAGQPTAYDQMVTLQNWFRLGFDYNPNVSRGHSIRSIEAFLRAEEGYCEQFATTFAAFARVLGVPSRVAVGFTPGDIDADGVWHVLGKHAHAWPEVWFDSVGWVAFEPTPGRGAPGATSYTNVEPDQAGGVLEGTPDTARAPGSAAGDEPGGQRPTATTVFSGGRPNIPKDLPEQAGGRGAGTAAAGSRNDGGGISPWLIPGSAMLAVLAWMVFMPLVVGATRRRRQHDGADRIVGAWDRAARWLGIVGAPRRADETPIEHAERAWRTTGVGRDQVRELAREATRATFQPVEPSPEVVERCTELSRRVTRVAREQLDWKRRLLVRLDPRLFR